MLSLIEELELDAYAADRRGLRAGARNYSNPYQHCVSVHSAEEEKKSCGNIVGCVSCASVGVLAVDSYACSYVPDAVNRVRGTFLGEHACALIHHTTNWPNNTDSAFYLLFGFLATDSIIISFP